VVKPNLVISKDNKMKIEYGHETVCRFSDLEDSDIFMVTGDTTLDRNEVFMRIKEIIGKYNTVGMSDGVACWVNKETLVVKKPAVLWVNGVEKK